MFISNALAQAVETTEAAASAPESSLLSFAPLVLIFAVFYFLIVRPQSKKIKEHQALLNDLKIGNKVVTSGGIIGVVKNVDAKENQVEVEIADGVRIKILKNAVAELVLDQKKDSKK
jgi:preprotein translocase subunit YajC